MYRTSKLQKMLIDFLKNNNIEIQELKDKEELTKIGTKQLIKMQFVGNTYFERKKHIFNANFNIYVVDKTLSLEEKNRLLDTLDDIRGLLIGARVEYEEYVSKEKTVIIDSENYTDTKSSVFVYTMKISVEVKLKNTQRS